MPTLTLSEIELLDDFLTDETLCELDPVELAIASGVSLPAVVAYLDRFDRLMLWAAEKLGRTYTPRWRRRDNVRATSGLGAPLIATGEILQPFPRSSAQ